VQSGVKRHADPPSSSQFETSHGDSDRERCAATPYVTHSIASSTADPKASRSHRKAKSITDRWSNSSRTVENVHVQIFGWGCFVAGPTFNTIQANVDSDITLAGGP
jgi:hypothetical protein